MAPPTAPNQVLTAFAMSYVAPDDFIADLASPLIGVSRSVFEYFVAEVDKMYRDIKTEISENGTATEIQVEGAYTAGKALDESVVGFVPQTKIDDFASAGGYDPKQSVVKLAKTIMQRRREIRVKTLLMASGTYAAANRFAAPTKWDNAAAEPLKDLLKAQRLCLLSGDTAVIPAASWSLLAGNAATIKAINPMGGDTVTEAAVLNYLRAYGFRRLLVGKAKYASTKEGQTTQTIGDIWSTDNVAVYHGAQDSSDPNEPRFIASFGRELGGKGIPILVREWWEDGRGALGAQAIATSRIIVEKVTAQLCGSLITDTET